MRPSVEAVRRALRHAAARVPDLFASDARLVVGFSGGQDSTCLLHALSTHGPIIIAAHIDHALRPDSAETAGQAAERARQLGVQALVRRVDVAAYRARQRGWSVQQAARVARYQALAAIVREHHARALLVAHTADDQAETLLLHLLRGSGLSGLSGMRLDEEFDPGKLGPRIEPGCAPASVRVARPLLSVPRATTLAYCTDLGLTLVEDASNQSRAYTRNRVRLDLLPALERFNPSIRTVLARTADLLAEDESALEHVVERLHAQLATSDDQSVRYEVDGWRAHPRGLQRRLLRHSLQLLLGQTTDVHARAIDDALDLLASGRPGQTYHLPYGVELLTSRRFFEMRLHGAARSRSRANIRDLAAPCV
ncbi:MAG: tRNA lysidine(34) synthetase TilS [Chloroflexi bacterium]|nr:tRNA lysidine(34) synthetase TilS [Chloroflexota bacterium]